MKVSVVIPTWNRAPLLKRAIRSILCQSCTKWDLWIIDDGGEDNSEEIVAGFQKDGKPNIHYRRIEHSGVSAARNTGVSLSDGGLIGFLDSDDEWHADKLKVQTSYLANSPDIPLVYSAEIWIRNGKRVNPPKHYAGASGRILSQSIRACIISPSTALMRRDVFDTLGGFREDYPVCEDYDLWLRLCSRYDVSFIDKPLVTRHGGRADQLSMITTAMDYWRVRSLAALAKTDRITADERATLNVEIVRRATVLLKGYQARGNGERITEIHGYLQTTVPDYPSDPTLFTTS